jgi:5-methyltetrahydropteroyltriglutamate--homocysteine methyltransferase
MRQTRCRSGRTLWHLSHATPSAEEIISMDFATTLVGSYPQPSWLIDRDALAVPRVRRPELWKVPSDRLGEAQDDAVRLTLADEIAAGIDIVTDGESRRESYSNLFANALAGLELDRPGTAPSRVAGATMVVPRVVSEIHRRGPVEVDEVAFLSSITDRPIKVTVPGPFTMSQQAEDNFYGDEAVLSLAYAAAVNAEARDLFAAGASVVQFDEPFFAARPDKARGFGLAALERALEGLSGTTAVHLCFGYAAMVPGRPGAYPFLAELADSSVDQISIETAQSHLDCGVLADLSNKSILLGVLDLSTEEVETPDEVVARVQRALPYVAPDRLILAPDCGMKFLSRHAALGKITSLGAAARLLRGDE